MCPGVVSEVPAKCPVCNMALVRRHRGEMTPSGDGGMARMQLSPYRVQFAGIRTATVEYRLLVYEVTTGGFVEASADPSRVSVQADVYEKDLALLAKGQRVEVSTDGFPGRTPLVGQVRQVLTKLTADRPSFRVRLAIDNPRRELRPGMFVSARVQVPASRLEWVTRALADDWREWMAADVAARAPALPGVSPAAGLEPLLGAACRQALQRRGLLLAVPDSAVIDTGRRKAVYVETSPGTFDAVEVAVGPRCGDFRPVLGRLEAGQRVVTAGAFLLDAETRLNPAAAAAYFGAARGPTPAASPTPPADPDIAAALAKLSPTDRALADRQRVCPVTGERLGAMGTPVRVEVAGKSVFLCCRSCERELRKHPDQYLSKLQGP
jgi:hypothetical protein